MKIAVILGNRINVDGSLTDTMLLRLELTLKLYKELAPDKIILSGGIANPKVNISESQAMYDYLLDKDIPREILIQEDKSLTTRQNAIFSAKILKDLQVTEVILCSSREHINRFYLNPVRLFRRQLGRKSGIKLKVFTN